MWHSRTCPGAVDVAVGYASDASNVRSHAIRMCAFVCACVRAHELYRLVVVGVRRIFAHEG